MNLKIMKETIEIQLNGTISVAEFYAALRRVVGRCNLEGEKQEIMTVITDDANYPFTIDNDETKIDEDTRMISQGRWADGFIWDSINFALALPRKYAKVLSVFNGGTKMQAVPYDMLKDSGISDQYYTHVSNHLYFNSDMDSSSVILRLRARVDYTMPTAGTGEYDGMPDFAESMLTNGVLSALYSQPKHYDEAMLSLHRAQFNEDLRAFNYDIIIRNSHTQQTRFTDY